jgi:hypothetical protein
MGDKKPNQKRRKDNKTLSQKNKKGQGKYFSLISNEVLIFLYSQPIQIVSQQHVEYFQSQKIKYVTSWL